MDTTKVNERMTIAAKTIMPAWMNNIHNNNNNAKETKTKMQANTMTTADVHCPQNEQQEQEVVDHGSIDINYKVMSEYDDKSNDDENTIKDNNTIMTENISDIIGGTIDGICIRYRNDQLLQMRNDGITKTSPDCLKRFNSICRTQNFMLPKFAQQVYQQQSFLNSIQSINQQQYHHRHHYNQHHHHHHHNHQQNKQHHHQQQKQQMMKSMEKTLNEDSTTDGAATPSTSSNDSTIVRVSLGLHDEVKLNETQNAWQPSVLKRKKSNSNLTATDFKEQTVRKFRGILNKLTPDNFDLLVEEIKKLNINTMDLLNGITVVLFEKAIHDSNFAISYAKLCKSLATEITIQQPIGNNNNNVENEMSTYDKKKINQNVFVTELVKMCQFEFEKHFGKVKVNEQEMLKVKQQLKSGATAATAANTTDGNDPSNKNQNNLIVEEQLIEDQHRLRRRSVCTVRFIGELYKNNILTINIMDWCIHHLLDVRSEEKLECVCRLLTTIGEKIEMDSVERKQNDKRYIELEPYFDQMQSIATPNKRSQKPQVSARVRFMIQDVIDLKRNKWVPRRVELKQQTIEEIKNEFELN